MKIFLIVVIACAAFQTSGVLACLCSFTHPRIMMEEADYIYFGTLTNIESRSEKEVLGTFKVNKILKGEPDTDKAWFYTSSRTTCRINAVENAEYVIYGDVGEEPSISFCSYSTKVSEFTKNELEKIYSSRNEEIKLAACLGVDQDLWSKIDEGPTLNRENIVFNEPFLINFPKVDSKNAVIDILLESEKINWYQMSKRTYLVCYQSGINGEIGVLIPLRKVSDKFLVL